MARTTEKMVFHNHSFNLPLVDTWIDEMINLSLSSFSTKTFSTTDQLVESLKRYDVCFRELLKQTKVYSAELSHTFGKLWIGVMKLLDSMIRMYHRHIYQSSHMQNQARQLIAEKQAQVAANKIADEEKELDRTSLRATIRNLEGEIETLRYANREYERENLQLRVLVETYIDIKDFDGASSTIKQNKNKNKPNTPKGRAKQAVAQTFSEKHSKHLKDVFSIHINELNYLDCQMNEIVSNLQREKYKQQIALGQYYDLCTAKEELLEGSFVLSMSPSQDVRHSPGSMLKNISESNFVHPKDELSTNSPNRYVTTTAHKHGHQVHHEDGVSQGNRRAGGSTGTSIDGTSIAGKHALDRGDSDATLVDGDVAMDLTQRQLSPKETRVVHKREVKKKYIEVCSIGVQVDERDTFSMIDVQDYAYNPTEKTLNSASPVISNIIIPGAQIPYQIRYQLTSFPVSLRIPSEDWVCHCILSLYVHKSLQDGRSKGIRSMSSFICSYYKEMYPSDAIANMHIIQFLRGCEIHSKIKRVHLFNQQIGLDMDPESDPYLHIYDTDIIVDCTAGLLEQGELKQLEGKDVVAINNPFNSTEHIPFIQSEISRNVAIEVSQGIFEKIFPDNANEYLMKLRALNCSPKGYDYIYYDDFIDLTMDQWVTQRHSWYEHLMTVFNLNCSVFKVQYELQFANDNNRKDRDVLVSHVHRPGNHLPYRKLRIYTVESQPSRITVMKTSIADLSTTITKSSSADNNSGDDRNSAVKASGGVVTVGTAAGSVSPETPPTIAAKSKSISTPTAMSDDSAAGVLAKEGYVKLMTKAGFISALKTVCPSWSVNRVSDLSVDLSE